MKISYKFDDMIFKSENSKCVFDKSFFLNNEKGDFLNLGVVMNNQINQGLVIRNEKENKYFKFIDEICLKDVEIASVEFDGSEIVRKFKSKFAIEELNSEQVLEIEDRFFLGPSGGMIYEILNYEGEISFDFDFRKLFNFKQHCNYESFVEDGIIFVKGEISLEKSSDEKVVMFLGIKSQNFSYEILNKRFEKVYGLSKRRDEVFKREILKFLKANIISDKKFYFGVGFSKDEVLKEIKLLEKYGLELKKHELNVFVDNARKQSFEKPILENVNVAYRLSENVVKKALKSGGFSNYLKCIKINRVLIDLKESKKAKKNLFELLERLDLDRCVNLKTAYWLIRRFGDLCFKLKKDDKLFSIFEREEIKQVFDKFYLVFTKITKEYWNREFELIEIDKRFKLESQMYYLGLIFELNQFLVLLKREDRIDELIEIENEFRENIVLKFFKNGFLLKEFEKENSSSQVNFNYFSFLAYYIYPNLLNSNDWESNFDKLLVKMFNEKGAVYFNMKRKITNFEINNLIGICLSDLNDVKYREQIKKILIFSTEDILFYGCLSNASELFCFKDDLILKNETNIAASASYVEFVNKLFLIK